MTIELLGENIEREYQLIKQIMEISNNIDSIETLALSNTKVDLNEKNLLLSSISPLLSQLKIINNAIPDILLNISFYPSLDKKELKKPAITAVKYQDISGENKQAVGIKKNEETIFIKNLTLGSSILKKINLKDSKTADNFENLNFFIGISNRFFRDLSLKLVEKGFFSSLKEDLRKITSPFLLNSYVAMMLFTVSLLTIFSVVLAGILLLFGASFLISFFVFILFPTIGFIAFYLYPSSQRKTLEKEINQELPFVTIYMAAIATSGIEPSKIFNVIIASNDYPFIRREIKKLNNLINFYGYDLVSALRNMSKLGPSERLSQLFNGLATTISSGGELTEFLNKHSESLLFDYRLEREKYTGIAETFMNIYISVVIAAPMIMMMLFVLMSITNFASGISVSSIGILMTLAIILLNLGFLFFLNLKQPKF